MSTEDLITVYRSMDANAKQDCDTIVDLLAAQGITANVVDDTAPGVPEGTFEVRVAPPDAAKAETIIAENPLADEVEVVDPSENLDLETIFDGGGMTAEMEAMGIKSVLEANGIAAVMVGPAVLPNLTFQVHVAREQAERARQLIAEAQKAGPAAAEEAELESEANPKP